MSPETLQLGWDEVRLFSAREAEINILSFAHLTKGAEPILPSEMYDVTYCKNSVVKRSFPMEETTLAFLWPMSSAP